MGVIETLALPLWSFSNVGDSVACAHTLVSALFVLYPPPHTDEIFNSHFTDEGLRQGSSKLSKISPSLSHTEVDVGLGHNFVFLILNTITMRSCQMSLRIMISLVERPWDQHSGTCTPIPTLPTAGQVLLGKLFTL